MALKTEIHWLRSLEDGLARGAREKRPVLLDFTAAPT